MSAKSVWLLLFVCASRLLIASSLENDPASPARTTVTSHIPRKAVASKGIASIGYSKRLHILEIEFVNGAVYRYLEVAPSVHRELMAAIPRRAITTGTSKEIIRLSVSGRG